MSSSRLIDVLFLDKKRICSLAANEYNQVDQETYMFFSQWITKTVVCLAAVSATPELKLSAQESFFLKRITEFWKDKDYALVKSQIAEFLKEHPKSPVADNLLAILGDIHFQEGHHLEALAAYQQISGVEFQRKTLHRHIQCLQKQKDTDAIIRVATLHLSGGVENENDIRFALATALLEKFRGGDLVNLEELAIQAKDLYTQLLQTSYRDTALYPLAEVHRILREYPEACSYYQELATKHPESAEDLLMLAASLQLGFDKNSAIDTYERVYSKDGEKAPVAAYNQFVLLYQESRFADLVGKSGSIEKRISKEKAPLFHFCLGRSHYALEHWPEAVTFLEKYVSEEANNPEQKKAAYLSLISCAHKMDDGALFDKTLEELLSAFPQDHEAAKALLLHAQDALQKQRLSDAAADLGRVLTQFPDIEQKETILYDRSLLLSQTKNWEESRSSFLTFLDQFPETSHGDLIWGYILNCSIQQLKGDPSDTLKKQFAQDLKIALHRDAVFTPEERPSYQYLLGKTLFELGNYDEAVETLETALATYPDNTSAPNGHLLLAYCYREKNPGSESFVLHAKKALELGAEHTDRGTLHLQLFNAFLAMNRLEEAADHLFFSFVVEGLPIQKENQLWLANYYYQQSKQGKATLDRAQTCFMRILGIEDDLMRPKLASDQTFLEAEALKFADLLPSKKKIALLQALCELQEKNPRAPWKFQRQALYELAKSHEANQETDQALQIYERLINTSSQASSYFSSAAALEKARILYTRCPEEDRVEKNPKMVQILSSLKDLQIQKKLVSEPIHLEAALEYADMRIKMASADSRAESALFYLARIREDFSAQEDQASKEYHEARLHSPDKDALFQTYMKCIEAEMLRLEAAILRKENQKDKAKRSEEASAALLQEVLADSSITVYLRTRVELNLKHLGQ